MQDRVAAHLDRRLVVRAVEQGEGDRNRDRPAGVHQHVVPGLDVVVGQQRDPSRLAAITGEALQLDVTPDPGPRVAVEAAVAGVGQWKVREPAAGAADVAADQRLVRTVAGLHRDLFRLNDQPVADRRLHVGGRVIDRLGERGAGELGLRTPGDAVEARRVVRLDLQVPDVEGCRRLSGSDGSEVRVRRAVQIRRGLGVASGDDVISDGNLISGNTGSGIHIFGNTASGNQVFSNLIGTDFDAFNPAPNKLSGVTIESAPDNRIGDGLVGLRNVISGNGEYGIQIFGAGATGNRVEHNHIGIVPLGANLGNGRDGVYVAGGSNNTIGGVENDEANVIAFNGANGVGHGVVVASGTGNAIRGNQIFSNNGLGIDLGGDGLTDNDPLDADPGANRLQNFPTFTAKIVDGIRKSTGYCRRRHS